MDPRVFARSKSRTYCLGAAERSAFPEPKHILVRRRESPGHLPFKCRGANPLKYREQSTVVVEVSELGKLLPSNVALEFSLQFRSVIVFGQPRLITDIEEAHRVMYRTHPQIFPHDDCGQRISRDH